MDKIAVIPLGHKDYIGDGLYEIMREIEGALDKDAFIYPKIQTIATTDSEAVEAARKSLRMDCGGVILLLATWVECPVVMSAIKELGSLPVLIWGYPMVEVGGKEISTGSYVSAAMLSGVVKRLGMDCECLIGSFRDKGTVRKIEGFRRAARAVSGLKYSNIGLVGYTSMGIYTGTFDHMLMRYIIGPEIKHMDAYTLISRAERLDSGKLEEALEALRGRTVLDGEIPADVLRRTAGLYIAIKEICENEKWDAVNIKCQYEFSKEFRATPCIALSCLATKA
jgi:L-fucose isomerase-like protein